LDSRRAAAREAIAMVLQRTDVGAPICAATSPLRTAELGDI
jgi:hypothetical protein